MNDRRKSAYEELLIELGFERAERPANASDLDRQLALAGSKLEKPMYVQGGGVFEMTVVVDEVGNLWRAFESIDLSVHGFTNALEDATRRLGGRTGPLH